MKDLFINAESMWCTHHIENNDAETLRSLGVNDKDCSRIMADIYGFQNEILLQNGLADAENVDDFKARLDSLQFAWDNIVNGFHHWFKQWRSEMFIECLILSAIKEHHGISRRFTTNGLELKQYLQKKMIDEDEVPKEIVSVSKALKTWIQSYYFAMSFTPQCLRDI